jgi:murein DD-endopeptidase MepM/ murein hydrolase activator NlpD
MARRARLVARTAVLLGMAALLGTFLAAPIPADARSGPDPSFRSPVEPFRALRLFDRPDTPWGPGHRGIDLEADVGQEVLAPGDVVVTFAGPVADRGVISIGHGGGWVSSLEPVSARVSAGDRVGEGDAIGVVTDEPGHCFPDPCLHWGVRRDGAYVNPLDVLVGFGPVRLLPLPATGLD